MSDKEEKPSLWDRLSVMMTQHHLEASDLIIKDYAKIGVIAERFGFIELAQSKDDRVRGIGTACATNPNIRELALKTKMGRGDGPIDQDHFCVVIIEGENWYCLNGIVMLHEDRPFKPDGWGLVDNVARRN